MFSTCVGPCKAHVSVTYTVFYHLNEESEDLWNFFVRLLLMNTCSAVLRQRSHQCRYVAYTLYITYQAYVYVLCNNYSTNTCTWTI